MAIKEVTPQPKLSEEELEMLGVEVDTEDYESFTPRRSVKDLNKVRLDDISVGTEVTGEPDFAIFINDEKEINGVKYEAKNWDTLNMRLFSDEDYLEIYINIPKIDENGFVTNIHHDNQFYQNAFNLIFGYFRAVDETIVVDPDSQNGYRNIFKKIHIENFVEKLNELTDMKIKVTEGQNGYNGFIVKEIWD